MDANEDVIDEIMCKQLNKANLAMTEVVFSQTRRKGPKMFFRGSVAIEGIWVTEDLEVTAAANLPFNQELGDHRPVVLNITETSILGVSGQKSKPTAAQATTKGAATTLATTTTASASQEATQTSKEQQQSKQQQRQYQ